MHVNAKKTAYAGLLLALTILFMFLGSVIETNTLFLLAAASFFVGVVVREGGIRAGVAFYIAACILGLIASPNKFYVVSFAAMGFYILICEISSYWIWKKKKLRRPKAILWAIKYLIFNLMFLPILFLFQRILFGRTLSFPILSGIILAGQGGIYLFDKAYGYFQTALWTRMRRITIG